MCYFSKWTGACKIQTVELQMHLLPGCFTNKHYDLDDFDVGIHSSKYSNDNDDHSNNRCIHMLHGARFDSCRSHARKPTCFSSDADNVIFGNILNQISNCRSWLISPQMIWWSITTHPWGKISRFMNLPFRLGEGRSQRLEKTSQRNDGNDNEVQHSPHSSSEYRLICFFPISENEQNLETTPISKTISRPSRLYPREWEMGLVFCFLPWKKHHNHNPAALVT